MLRILKNRLLNLGCGEEGVALVVTLGIFMFLYVACASVYAIGTAVKEKMHLQGACDAAAYSAAIVQADTLSRIATINRAMSWTYQQMTRRQMDYIVWQWLCEVVEHYDADRRMIRSKAAEWNAFLSGGNCSHQWHYGNPTAWGISSITLNETKVFSRAFLHDLCKDDGGFDVYLRDGETSAGVKVRDSFYSQRAGLDHLGDQIDDDLKNIRDMSQAVDAMARGLPNQVNVAVAAILNANVPAYMTAGDLQYYVKQVNNPRSRYFQTFPNTRYHEQIFLSLSGTEIKDQEQVFEAGIDDWFELGGEQEDDYLRRNAEYGIHRWYDRSRSKLSKTLKATWNWYVKAMYCDRSAPAHQPIPTPGFVPHCPHVPHQDNSLNDNCQCDNITGKAHCLANNGNSYDHRFKGQLGGEDVCARPLKLTESYFGEDGTITVGLARRNENPWFSLFGRMSGGVYSAFSPVSNSWSYCFASAKAGYKLYHVPKDYYIYAHRGEEDSTVYREDWEERYNGTVRVYNGPRDYCVDWKDDGSRFQDWIQPYERDARGNIVRDGNGNKKKGNTVITYWTDPTELRPSWRQSWNLVQDDWDAVMVPVRQGGSRGDELAAYSLQEWWRKRLQDYGRNAWHTIPYRFEPVWRNRNSTYLASLVNNAQWRALSGSGVPNTSVAAGPNFGDIGDPLNGQLVGQLWLNHWQNGNPPPTATGTSQWNIGRPGQGLSWRQIGAEMYH